MLRFTRLPSAQVEGTKFAIFPSHGPAHSGDAIAMVVAGTREGSDHKGHWRLALRVEADQQHEREEREMSTGDGSVMPRYRRNLSTVLLTVAATIVISLAGLAVAGHSRADDDDDHGHSSTSPDR
jgi:hypothetical protein